MAVFDERLMHFLLPPWTDADARVLVLDIRRVSQDSSEFLRINPWFDVFSPSSTLLSDLGALSVLGLPSSLARALRGSIPMSLQKEALESLSALVEKSSCACEQLVAGKLLPLIVLPPPSADLQALVQRIEQQCVETWREVAYARNPAVANDDWLGWPSTYDLCLRLPTSTMWVHLGGVHKTMSRFDLNGDHLTGERLWAGALTFSPVGSLLSTPCHRLGSAPVPSWNSGLASGLRAS